MFEQTIIDAINTTLQSFDLTYCIIVNILTYLIIQRFDIDKRVNNLNTWQKRLVFGIVCIFVAIVYYFTGYNSVTSFSDPLLGCLCECRTQVFLYSVLKPQHVLMCLLESLASKYVFLNK